MSAKQMCFKGFFGRSTPFRDEVVALEPKSSDMGIAGSAMQRDFQPSWRGKTVLD